ncbi:MAG: hypothetical protein O7E54_01900 [Planctomycetota bacterium]|nr:hypothetical protein [Planctomycetota bacterium]
MAAEVAVPARRRFPSRRLARIFASAGFVVLVVGLTYFGALVLTIAFGGSEMKAAALREVGLFLTGKEGWLQDARVYGALSLVLALLSLFFGNHPLARITLVASGLVYLTFLLAGEEITVWIVGIVQGT